MAEKQKKQKVEKGDRGFAFFFTQKKWDVLFGEHRNKTTFNRKNDEEISVTRKTKAEIHPGTMVPMGVLPVAQINRWFRDGRQTITKSLFRKT